MIKTILRGGIAIALFFALFQSSAAAAITVPVAAMVINPTMVYWEPLVDFDQLVLTVTGSGDAYSRQVFSAGSTPVFDLFDQNGEPFPDGSCTYELTVVPYLDPATKDLLSQSRESGDNIVDAYNLPKGSTQFGYFQIKDGLVITPSLEGGVPQSDDGIDQMHEGPIDTVQDQVILDDLIVDGSLCVGQDCTNGENFGFDTIRLKENNLRIRFTDTSASSSFPTRDWQITVNDSSNGGADKFSIDDIDTGRTPFTIRANAPSNSLYVSESGNVGIKTATPSTDIHILSGNTPTLRLAQDGSSGFTPQTWDVAGNEANFFIRDATNSGNLPFRIQPSAPSNSLFINNKGYTGSGTSTPDAPLNVEWKLTEATQPIAIFDTSSVAGSTEVNRYPLMKYVNKGHFLNYLVDTGSDGSTWSYGLWDQNFLIDVPGDGTWLFKLETNGNLTLHGTLTTHGNTYPDYVFEHDYSLMPLADLHDYIKDNKHLPNIPKSDSLKKNGINMTEMQMKLLEKVEELTLYTIAQEKTINELRSRLEKIENK